MSSAAALFKDPAAVAAAAAAADPVKAVMALFEHAAGRLDGSGLSRKLTDTEPPLSALDQPLRSPRSPRSPSSKRKRHAVDYCAVDVVDRTRYEITESLAFPFDREDLLGAFLAEARSLGVEAGVTATLQETDTVYMLRLRGSVRGVRQNRLLLKQWKTQHGL